MPAKENVKCPFFEMLYGYPKRYGVQCFNKSLLVFSHAFKDFLGSRQYDPAAKEMRDEYLKKNCCEDFKSCSNYKELSERQE